LHRDPRDVASVDAVLADGADSGVARGGASPPASRPKRSKSPCDSDASRRRVFRATRFARQLVFRAVDDALAAASEFLLDAVVGDSGAGGRQWGRPLGARRRTHSQVGIRQASRQSRFRKRARTSIGQSVTRPSDVATMRRPPSSVRAASSTTASSDPDAEDLRPRRGFPHPRRPGRR
jgi:hypothetical protein